MVSYFFSKNKFALKWIGLAFVIKLILFIFFAINFYQNFSPSLITNGIFVASGDTALYYGAAESFVNGNGYYTSCRMPGLLPIYCFFRLFFSISWAKTLIIVTQFLLSVVSVYLLAKTAKLIFKKDRIFLITFFVYAFSSFVSIWDHIGYADSFGTSFLIFSIFFSVKFKISNNWREILLSGIFIIWSVFLRPIHGIVIPFIILIFIFNPKNIIQSVKFSVIYLMPVIFFLSLWTYSNYSKFNKIIVLQGKSSECFPGITEELLSIRILIIGWGEDIQPWSKNSAGEWFFSKSKMPAPSNGSIYSSEYNLDSLISLRSLYVSKQHATSYLSQEVYKNKIIEASNRYLISYKKEHFFRYYFLNKFLLLKKFIIPDRLDNLPFPAYDKMTFLQKVTKGFYYILLILINIFGILGCIIGIRKKQFIAIIPLAILFILCPVMGFIEQRYLVPCYGFFVLFTASVIDSVMDWIGHKVKI